MLSQSNTELLWLSIDMQPYLANDVNYAEMMESTGKSTPTKT